MRKLRGYDVRTDVHDARVCSEDAAEDVEQRGLPCAVRPDNPDHMPARRYGQGHIFEDFDPAEGFADRLGPQEEALRTLIVGISAEHAICGPDRCGDLLRLGHVQASTGPIGELAYGGLGAPAGIGTA